MSARARFFQLTAPAVVLPRADSRIPPELGPDCRCTSTDPSQPKVWDLSLLPPSCLGAMCSRFAHPGLLFCRECLAVQVVDELLAPLRTRLPEKLAAELTEEAVKHRSDRAPLERQLDSVRAYRIRGGR